MERRRPGGDGWPSAGWEGHDFSRAEANFWLLALATGENLCSRLRDRGFAVVRCGGMRRISALLSLLLLCTEIAPARKRPIPPLPQQFEIGSRTFFDFGPPFQYFDIFVVRPTESGVSVEKIALTPPGNACIQPATIQVTKASLAESVSNLLHVNPCAIPERELRRERKRCKNCQRYSGADVSMRVQCGSETHIIRSDILEKDWFEPQPNTPEHTSWFMQLLGKLAQVTGPGPLDQPAFHVADDAVASNTSDKTESPTIRELADGKFDTLFQSTDKPSQLYRDSLVHPPDPSVELLSATPVSPENPVLPKYPPLARMARIQGNVVLDLLADVEGNVTDESLVSGHPILVPAAKEAAMHWKFPNRASGQRIRIILNFATNCSEDTNVK